MPHAHVCTPLYGSPQCGGGGQRPRKRASFEGTNRTRAGKVLQGIRIAWSPRLTLTYAEEGSMRPVGLWSI